MAGRYTIKKLTEVEDAAAKSGFGHVQEARFAADELEAEQTGVSLHRVRPGVRQAFGHRHRDAEEVYVVLSGSGRIKLDDQIAEVGERDAIRVSGSHPCLRGRPGRARGARLRTAAPGRPRRGGPGVVERLKASVAAAHAGGHGGAYSRR